MDFDVSLSRPRSQESYLKAVGRVLSGDGPVDKHKAAQAGNASGGRHFMRFHALFHPFFHLFSCFLVVSLGFAELRQVGVTAERRHDVWSSGAGHPLLG